MSARILVIDDELPIRSLLSRVLGREGYDVLTVGNGKDGLAMLSRQKPDLVVLDLNLPDFRGEDLCETMRSQSPHGNVPVLILTGKTGEGVSTRCLNGGADAYLPKPFDIQELLAHLRALLRRSQGPLAGQQEISSRRLTIRVEERLVLWEGRRMVPFAPKEFEILRLLVQNAPRVIDKDNLAINVWGVPLAQLHQRTLDVHVRRIRKKLGSAASCLVTVPAVGFQWLDPSVIPTPEPSRSR